jgi:hypothetical protein
MKLVQTGLFALLIIAFSSCKKNEACLQGPSELRLTETAEFSFCGEYKKTIRWKIFDGSTVTEGGGESISHTFNTITDSAYVMVYAEGNNEKKNDSMRLDISVKSYLMVTVKDDAGATVAGATVNFYASEQCFEDQSTDAACLLGTGITETDGTYEFELLEPDFNYIVEVVADEYRANWDANPAANMLYASELSDFADGTEFTIKNNTLYFLTSPSKWELFDIENSNGTSIWTSVPACRQDDHLLFYADGTYELTEGDQVCNPSFSNEGSWTDQDFTSWPPDFDIAVSKATGNADIDDNLIYVDNADNIRCSVSFGGTKPQTYYFRRVE